MSMFLGMDSSTQGLSAVVIDTELCRVVYAGYVNYGLDLPEYESPHGFLLNDDPLVKCSNPLMWLRALERLFEKMSAEGVDLHLIDGIGGCAQQHGTVYLRKEFRTEHWLDGVSSICDAVKPLLTRQDAPIWMDSSTFDECRSIESACGGSRNVRAISGSGATERFGGPQIRRFSLMHESAYEKTGVIHLISSFMCSALIGRSAPADYGDASGMNLLNLKTLNWDASLLEATAPRLLEKLPSLQKTANIAGGLHSYWCKFGFRANIPVTLWTGDNLSSLIGVGAWKAGTACVSLGTSDTYFSAMDKISVDPAECGHVFINPADGYMSLICFKNGSFAREKVKEEYGLTWSEFDNDAFDLTRPGNCGCMMLPYFTPEITPLVLNSCPFYRGNALFESRRDPASIVRALVEAQAMSMRIHSGWIGNRPKRIRVTGGASQSQGICQVFADVFNVTVERLALKNSADLGGALIAAHSILGTDWSKLTKQFCVCDSSRTVKPIEENVKIYEDLVPQYAAFEQDITG